MHTYISNAWLEVSLYYWRRGRERIRGWEQLFSTHSSQSRVESQLWLTTPRPLRRRHAQTESGGEEEVEEAVSN